MGDLVQASILEMPGRSRKFSQVLEAAAIHNIGQVNGHLLGLGDVDGLWLWLDIALTGEHGGIFLNSSEMIRMKSS